MPQDYGYFFKKKLIDGSHFNERIYKSMREADHDGYIPDALMRRNIQTIDYKPSYERYNLG